ncbi:hypothetical protein U9M48_033891 [Paspalum notatum var. saurae]|uniref:BTB domain-containing protein n=1 Tax=Paspalum notatum var. saurae TaxID=547442 RepID=A0AAQ3X6N8_PASNO
MANKRRRLLLETSSRCVTPFTQAAHTFEVSSFSLLDGAMGAGEFVSSSTFSAGGRDWNIRVYPDGTKMKEDDDEPGAWVSAFLRLLSGDATRTRFTIDVMEKDGTPWSASELISPAFEEAGDGWGCRRLVKKSSSLRSMLLRNDDCLMIRCELTVLGESHSEDVVGGGGGAMASPEPNLHGQLGRLLECGKGADVAFDVDGRVFHAHRCVLAARSPVFEAELFGEGHLEPRETLELLGTGGDSGRSPPGAARSGDVRPPARGEPLRAGSEGAVLRPRAALRGARSPAAAAAAPALAAAGRHVPAWAPERQREVELARACWPTPACLVLQPCGHSPPPYSAAVGHSSRHGSPDGVVGRRDGAIRAPPVAAFSRKLETSALEESNGEGNRTDEFSASFLCDVGFQSKIQYCRHPTPKSGRTPGRNSRLCRTPVNGGIHLASEYFISGECKDSRGNDCVQRKLDAGYVKRLSKVSVEGKVLRSSEMKFWLPNCSIKTWSSVPFVFELPGRIHFISSMIVGCKKAASSFQNSGQMEWTPCVREAIPFRHRERQQPAFGPLADLLPPLKYSHGRRRIKVGARAREARKIALVDVMEPIKVHDMEPAIFEELLHFVYTDSMSPSSSDFEDGGGVMVMPRLLVAADRYGLDRLRLMCEVKLCRGIDAKTVADTLALAERHHCARLKDACLGFIASRDANVLGVVMKTDGFKHLVASCPSVAVDILDKIAHG